MRISEEDFQYAVRVRRLLHQYPETGFDLPKTTEIVKNELDKMGIETTSRFAPCSLVGYVGKCEGKTVGLRADMDALPIEEETGLKYKSKNPGKMHACGHDVHTADLLCVARYLKRHESELPCRVKLIFQPSEECERSGAKEMVKNGVLEDVDAVFGTHCDNKIASDTIGLHTGPFMAACCPITLVFHGKSAHATAPESGVDALQMAIRSYVLMKEKAQELAGDLPYIFSVGVINGGTAHNIIADRCTVKITFRWFDYDFSSKLRKECFDILNRVCQEIGGTVDIDWEMSAPPVINHSETTELVRKVAQDNQIPWLPVAIRKASEDFGWFSKEKPGTFFRFGTGNEEKQCTSVGHTSTFQIDENGMKNAIEMLLGIVYSF